MKWFTNHLIFDRIEIRAFKSFIVVIFIWIAAKTFFKFYYFHDQDCAKALVIVNSTTQEEKKSVSNHSSNDGLDSLQQKNILDKSNLDKKEISSFTTFDFDPNSLSFDSLKLLGFNKHAANNLIKYRLKGGRINDANDLEKIYGTSEELLNRLKPFVKILPSNKRDTLLGKKTDEVTTKNISSQISIHKKVSQNKKIPYVKSDFYKNLMVEVNSADTSRFKLLHGIGSFYSKEIVKARTELGGFYSIDQLQDIWCINDSLYASIIHKLTIDSTLIQKININSCSIDDLAKHPYLSWKEAKFIVRYRDNHGPYQSSDDIKLGILKANRLDRMLPYLEFN